MKVVYVGMRYDYGDPRRGDCYEYRTFLPSLRNMPGVQVDHFPYDEILRSEGRRRMNQRLQAMAGQKPDLFFFVLYSDEIFPETIQWLTRHSGAVTVNWFGDDQWRFEVFSRFRAHLFTWCVTTDEHAVARYRAVGVANVIHSQWGFNHHEAEESAVDEDIDVSFVGQAHPGRKRLMSTLRSRGLRVETWGRGWENGPLSQREMVEVFKRTKVNLNFTGSVAGWNLRGIAKIALSRRADGTYTIRSPREIMPASRLLFSRPRAQIKGRNFEIPGHGGFLLTSAADGLDRYYVPGKEIAVWNDPRELVEKVHYYLAHDAERKHVKEEGRRRTLAEHTYEQRFRHLFRTMGLGDF